MSLRIWLLAVALLLHPGGATAAGPDIGGPFDLASSRGGRLTDADLKGRPHAVVFGYTYCPDVCPTILSELSATLQELGPAGADLRVLFVTVDPERDPPEQLAAYLGAFDERIVGLSGTAEETAAIARAFKATYRKFPLSGGDYSMDHTAAVYLIDRRGHFLELVDYRATRAEQTAAFRRLVEVR